MEKTNSIKFSTYWQEKRYYTSCDTEARRIKIEENGVVIFEDSMKIFKEKVDDKHHIYYPLYKMIFKMVEDMEKLLSEF